MADSADQYNILVVDDERSIREGVERVLSRMGNKVLTAKNGEEALDILKTEPVSIAILDLKMPGMDGMELHQRIREIDDRIVAIIITGYATIETAINAMKQGAYDFIPKPFEPDHLKIVVNRAIEKIRLSREAEALQAERARTLMDLDREKSRTRTIIESLPIGVVVTNPDGEVVLKNPAFLQSLELAKDLEAGESIDACVTDDGFCQFVRQLSTGEYSLDGEVPSYELCVGDNKYLLARGRPVMNEKNDCIGAVVTLSNITSLKMLDQLKSEFVAKVSHELRSPLSTIHEQLATVLKDMTSEESEVDQDLIERAKEKTNALISLIGDLLDLSRIEAGSLTENKKPVRITELLSSIVDFMKSRADGKGQTLTFNTGDSPIPEITADPMALESIFGNLVTNAINYTPSGGEITVTVETVDKQIRVAVSDTGFGIEKRHQDKIFERFYRVKDKHTRQITGTGLGLPIVKGLVDSMGGKIEIDSEPGSGSTFTVYLPLETPAETDADAASQSVHF
ncbi:MAG: ATP-binding protein [Desulfobacterales bacterium]